MQQAAAVPEQRLGIAQPFADARIALVVVVALGW